MNCDIKRCPGCNIEKPVGDFARSPNRRDGRNFICKSCKNARSKAAYHADLEASRARQRAYRQSKRMPDDRTPGLKWRAIERTGVTLDEFRAMLRYVPGTGLFYWRVNKKGPRRAGDVAGYTDKDGYICIGVSGYRYPAHRLAWLFTYGEWPTSDIDHKDGDRKNNRLSNLRIATRTQNNFNQKQLPTSVKSGLRGVRERSPGRWVASISFENRKFWLGTFDSREKAAAAYRERAEQLVGEFIGQLGDCHAE